MLVTTRVKDWVLVPADAGGYTVSAAWATAFAGIAKRVDVSVYQPSGIPRASSWYPRASDVGLRMVSMARPWPPARA